MDLPGEKIETKQGTISSFNSSTRVLSFLISILIWTKLSMVSFTAHRNPTGSAEQQLSSLAVE
ncbi:hypothetical protein BJY01DRAFT_208596 [Aspergillus pseudoustus]|uniref:Uncharacterized protein n=1 Tax=Aspergillus pseudoustus TaxID=1810923 RepID=A0ABR4KL67_9EURO